MIMHRENIELVFIRIDFFNIFWFIFYQNNVKIYIKNV
jgi:hypothetical protein